MWKAWFFSLTVLLVFWLCSKNEDTKETPVTTTPTLSEPKENATINTKSPYLDWSDIPNASKYEIQVDTVSSFTLPIVSVTCDSSYYQLPVLANNNHYYWRVRSMDINNQTNSWSQNSSFIIDTTKPGTDTLEIPILSSPGNNATVKSYKPSFDWQDVPRAKQYVIMVDLDSNASSVKISDTTTTSNYQSTVYLPKSVYYWKIKAIGYNNQVSNWSSLWKFSIEDSISTSTTYPVLITPINGDSIKDVQPLFDWTDVSGAIRYEMVLAEDINFTKVVLNPKTTTSEYKNTSNISAKTYYWKVRAEDIQHNWGQWSSVNNFKILEIPVLNRPKSGDSVYTTKPTFEWSSVSYAKEYQILVDNNADFSSPEIDQYTSSSQITSNVNFETGTYYWKVRAKDNQFIWHQWSEVSSFILPEIPLEILCPKNNDSTWGIFKWNAIYYATSYQIVIDDDPNFNYPTIYDTITPKNQIYLTNSLLVNKEYYLKIRAQDKQLNWHNWAFSIKIKYHYATASTKAATGTTQTETTLNGTVNWNNGGVTNVIFEWGLTTAYGNTAIASQSPLAIGTTVQSISVNLTGLTANTTYHYRVKAANEYGTIYGNDIAFTTLVYETSTVTDIDGNVYQTIKIGNQWWMAENLKVTKYRNGDAIPNVTDNSEWSGLSTGALCVYNNSNTNLATYGYLYNWYAVTDPRGLAPQGWHVPSKTEFETLLANCSKTGTACYDALINGGSSGFNALLGGCRGGYGNFDGYGGVAHFWSTTPGYSDDAWNLYLYSKFRVAYLNINLFQYGFSIRCLRD